MIYKVLYVFSVNALQFFNSKTLTKNTDFQIYTVVKTFEASLTNIFIQLKLDLYIRKSSTKLLSDAKNAEKYSDSLFKCSAKNSAKFKSSL